MVTDVHPDGTEDVLPQYRKNDAGPAEEPGQAGEERDKMDEDDWRIIAPLDPPRAALVTVLSCVTDPSRRALLCVRFTHAHPVDETITEKGGRTGRHPASPAGRGRYTSPPILR